MVCTPTSCSGKVNDSHIWYMTVCSIDTENLRRTMLFFCLWHSIRQKKHKVNGLTSTECYLIEMNWTKQHCVIRILWYNSVVWRGLSSILLALQFYETASGRSEPFRDRLGVIQTQWERGDAVKEVVMSIQCHHSPLLCCPLELSYLFKALSPQQSTISHPEKPTG